VEVGGCAGLGGNAGSELDLCIEQRRCHCAGPEAGRVECAAASEEKRIRTGQWTCMQTHLGGQVSTCGRAVWFRALPSLFLCVCAVLGRAGLSLAQDAPASQQQDPAKKNASPADPAESKPEFPSANSEKPGTTGEKTGEQKAEKTKKLKGAILIAPLPQVSPALGGGVIPVVGYIFPFQMKDKTSPPSVVGAAADITDNGTRLYVFEEDLYLKQAKYESKSAYAQGNINYNLYGVGFIDETKGFKLPLTQSGEVLFVNFLRNIGWDIYLGGRFTSDDSFVTLRPSSRDTPSIPPDVGLHTNLRALGFEVLRDSRPNRFYPVKGT
jgi:hypothetical protein